MSQSDSKLISDQNEMISRLKADLYERETRIINLNARVSQLEADLRDVESFRSREKQQHERDIFLLMSAISAFGGRTK